MDKQLDIWYNKKWNKICMDDIFLSNNKIYKDKVLNIIKVIFKNKTFSIHKNTFLQKNIKGGFISKIKILKNFFNKVINKYPEINCSIYIILNDHVTSDKYYINKTNINIENFYDEEKIKNINNDNKIYNKLNNYPFFSFVKPEKSNFICIPDTIFLKDYSKNDRDRNLTNNCIKNTLEKIQDYNINSPWDKKNNNFIFKSEYSKYNEIKNILNKIKIVNCNDNYITIEKQIKSYKYFIGTFLRWDTTYWNFLSNNVVFMINDIDNILYTHPILYKSFLSYYFEPYIDYIPFRLNNIEKVYNQYKNNEKYLKNMIEHSTKTAKELTFDRIVNEFGEMLLKYTKIYNS